MFAEMSKNQIQPTEEFPDCSNGIRKYFGFASKFITILALNWFLITILPIGKTVKLKHTFPQYGI